VSLDLACPLQALLGVSLLPVVIIRVEVVVRGNRPEIFHKVFRNTDF
jgi:hypothetical protein